MGTSFRTVFLYLDLTPCPYSSVKMDQLKGALNGFTGGNNQQTPQQSGQQSGQQQGGSSGGGFLGGLCDKFNAAAGGGRESEKNEDYLDKGVDLVQEKFLGQGPQDNESAVEQAKDEQISDFIRNKYKSKITAPIDLYELPTSMTLSTEHGMWEGPGCSSELVDKRAVACYNGDSLVSWDTSSVARSYTVMASTSTANKHDTKD